MKWLQVYLSLTVNIRNNTQIYRTLDAKKINKTPSRSGNLLT
jgi:hypothetical protein